MDMIATTFDIAMFLSRGEDAVVRDAGRRRPRGFPRPREVVGRGIQGLRARVPWSAVATRAGDGEQVSHRIKDEGCKLCGSPRFLISARERRPVKRTRQH